MRFYYDDTFLTGQQTCWICTILPATNYQNSPTLVPKPYCTLFNFFCPLPSGILSPISSGSPNTSENSYIESFKCTERGFVIRISSYACSSWGAKFSKYLGFTSLLYAINSSDVRLRVYKSLLRYWDQL